MKNTITLRNLAIVSLVVMFSFIMFAYAEPEGATVNYISNSSKNLTPPTGRQDDKGFIHVLTLETIQQNQKWKAYVGNVSGTLVLRDADSYSIYEWPAGGAPDGEVYITRNTSIDWTDIRCLNDTWLGTEQSALGQEASASDNINATFSSTVHESIDIHETTISNSTCRTVRTWVDNSAQAESENAKYQEVLLQDGDGKVVYAALIDQDQDSYRDDDQVGSSPLNATYDFQAIVPDYIGGATATYYFYVEISS